MASNRANLDTPPSNVVYLVLGILLILMSVLGWFLFKSLQPSDNIAVSLLPLPAPSTAIITSPAAPTALPSASSASHSPGVSFKPTSRPLPTRIPTQAPSPTLTVAAPTPASLVLQDVDGYFSLRYPSYRRLYTVSENNGHRYTLYSSSGIITIHTTSSWSWTHPGRRFSSDVLVAGLPTFVYETGSQTIVDFESGEIKFTIQCVHNNSESIRSECDGVLGSFKLR